MTIFNVYNTVYFRCLSLPDWFVEWLEDGENTPEDVIDFIGNF